jgi:hypothetical protein
MSTSCFLFLASLSLKTLCKNFYRTLYISFSLFFIVGINSMLKELGALHTTKMVEKLL